LASDNSYEDFTFVEANMPEHISHLFTMAARLDHIEKKHKDFPPLQSLVIPDCSFPLQMSLGGLRFPFTTDYEAILSILRSAVGRVMRVMVSLSGKSMCLEMTNETLESAICTFSKNKLSCESTVSTWWKYLSIGKEYIFSEK
jgi:hypothetical protein